MALADLPLDHRILKSLRRTKRAQHVRDGRSGLSEALGQLLLGEGVGLHQQLVRARGLDRVEIGTLQVLDERELESVSDLAAHASGARGVARKWRGPNGALSR